MGGGAELLIAALDELAADDVTGRSLRDELLVLESARARLDAEVARRLRAFDTSTEWSVDGSRSAAAFLVRHTRCARGEAHHRVRVAREVSELDDTARAWAQGVVTTRHVEAIARARHSARANEAFAQFEPALVAVARAGTPEEVTRTAAQWRDALDADLDRDGSGAHEQHERRRFDFSRSLNGMGFGALTLDTIAAEWVETALNRAYEALHRADDPRTPTQQRADALVEIFRSYLQAQSRRTNLPTVLVVTDHQTLEGDAVGECRLASGHRISPDTARRLICDSYVQDIIIDGTGVPLAMGRAARTFTPDQFRAMVVRDQHCRGPGCAIDAAFCDAHHLAEYDRDHGNTDLDNGALFCRGNCHRMVHEGGWTVTGSPNATLEFRDRTGQLIGTSTPAPRPTPILTKQGRKRHELQHRARARAHALTRRARISTGSG